MGDKELPALKDSDAPDAAEAREEAENAVNDATSEQ